MPISQPAKSEYKRSDSNSILNPKSQVGFSGMPMSNTNYENQSITISKQDHLEQQSMISSNSKVTNNSKYKQYTLKDYNQMQVGI